MPDNFEIFRLFIHPCLESMFTNPVRGEGKNMLSTVIFKPFMQGEPNNSLQYLFDLLPRLKGAEVDKWVTRPLVSTVFGSVPINCGTCCQKRLITQNFPRRPGTTHPHLNLDHSGHKSQGGQRTTRQV